MVQKNFGQKNVGSKKFWCFGSKKFWGLKNFGSQMFWGLRILYPENLGSENVGSQKMFSL